MSSKPYTLYKIGTGQVISGGTADDPTQLETSDSKVLIGEIYTSGWIDDTGWHPVPGDAPGPWHEFDFVTKRWVDSRTVDEAWSTVRFERARRLLASDWTQLPDVPLSTKEVWAAYRQALRDITEQLDPFNIVWPTAPQ